MSQLSLTALSTPTNKRKLFAFGMSLAIFMLMSGLLFIKKNLDDMLKDELVIREITLAAPPPPPPPPQQQQQRLDTEIQLNIDGEGPPIKVSKIAMEDPLEALQLVSPVIKTLTTDWDLDLQVDWAAFGLDDLDGVPVLLTPLRSGNWPRALSNRGIDHATVKLEIFIDENGRLSLIGVSNNEYPELMDSINRVIRTTRFSIPQKAGQPVRARFIWSVEFTES